VKKHVVAETLKKIGIFSFLGAAAVHRKSDENNAQKLSEKILGSLPSPAWANLYAKKNILCRYTVYFNGGSEESISRLKIVYLCSEVKVVVTLMH
jgi:hypothetical protein